MDPALRRQAELLLDVYDALPEPSHVERVVPNRIAGSKDYAVHGSLHEAISRLVKLEQNEPSQFRKYGEAFETVTMTVRKAAGEAASALLTQQFNQLTALERRFARPGIAESLHKLAANVQGRVGDFSPSAEDHQKARAALGREPAVLGPAQGPDASPAAVKDPPFEDATQQFQRSRIAGAMAKELVHFSSRSEVRQLWQILFLHPDFIEIMKKYAESADTGDEYVRGLVVEAMGATLAFDRKLHDEPHRLWRYPPLILLGTKRLGLYRVDGFNDYILALLPTLRGVSFMDVLYIAGWIVFLVAVAATASGELAAAVAAGGVGEAAVATGISAADMAVAIPPAVMTYMDEKELDLAATGSGFSPKVRLAEKQDYEGTKLAAVAALLAALGFVSASATFLRNLRNFRFNMRMVRPAARPRGAPDPVRSDKMRLREHTTPDKRGPAWLRRPERDLDPARRMAVGAPPPEEPLRAVSHERAWLTRPKTGAPTDDLAPVASGAKPPKPGGGVVPSGVPNVHGSPATGSGSKATGSTATASKATVANPTLAGKDRVNYIKRLWERLKANELTETDQHNLRRLESSHGTKAVKAFEKTGTLPKDFEFESLSGTQVVNLGTSPLKPGQDPLGHYAIDKFVTYENRPNDLLAGHEILQNKWLEVHGFGKRLQYPASQNNPAVGLLHGEHVDVGSEQIKLGLYKASNLKNMTAMENIELNAEAMRRAGIPQHVIEIHKEAAIRYGRSLGVIP